jgi:alkylation response protein AidB-like acyl-CoA dehydrogenase
MSCGGAFLVGEVGAEPVPTPEGFSDEQRQFFRTAYQFTQEQVLARAAQIEKKDNALLRTLLRQAGELGLLAVDLPEAYGGLALDKTTSMLVAEAASILGSWSVTFSAHTGIGVLPIAWFGTAAQKAKYLPGLATGEKVASYALTEQGSGSDALGAKTRAVLTSDKRHFALTGSKLYITNAAFADVFVVFAKVDGERFSAFIVERGTPGMTIGPEEHKMGIRGSSTCPLFFEDAQVPAENLLGEVGKGHKIAFNILNLGRLKLGVGMLGGMKHQTSKALRFAADRQQFATPILRFALTREKLARMASLIYAVESMAYRTAGLIDRALAGTDPASEGYAGKTVAAMEEFAIESSILKVFGSEANGQVADDAVQIHGGAGFIEEFAPERAYRDARINRIFEGTNEINRLLICTMLLKRAAQGSVPLAALAQTAERELADTARWQSDGSGPLAHEAQLAQLLKHTAVYLLQSAASTLGNQLEAHQEALAAIADVVMDAYAMDSLVARTLQGGGSEERVAMTRLFAVEARARSLDRARKAICAYSQGAARERHLALLAPLTRFEPYEPVALREAVVKRMEAMGGYPLPFV